MNFNPKFTQPSFLFLNLRNVRLLWCGVIGVLLALAGSNPVRSQDPPPSVQQPDQYFAGVVTALTDDSITLTRTVLGKATVRSFAISAETVVQPQGGKPKLKSEGDGEVGERGKRGRGPRGEDHSARVGAAA
jgi:hypothetical protein